VGEGYALIVNDLDPFRCEGVAGALSADGATVMAMTGDVSVREQAEELVEMATGGWGRLDVLVNCAGIFPNTPVIEMDDAEWDRVYGTNLRGPFLLSRAAARAMIAGNSGEARHIVNISSTAGESARTGAAHYCGSKAALNMLTKVLAIELAPHGIRVNSVAPGIIVDDVYERASPPADPYVAALLAGIPLGRTGRGDDIAGAVRFLLTPAAEWITGEIIHVNGGSTAGRVTLPPSQF
ncbi:MAG TPA: SDR family oxidoreductase, partial [Thermomicrobiales bacterium]|nr:SDR family oxidoreductase [Thermomicrobiales bacterium]